MTLFKLWYCHWFRLEFTWSGIGKIWAMARYKLGYQPDEHCNHDRSVYNEEDQLWSFIFSIKVVPDFPGSKRLSSTIIASKEVSLSVLNQLKWIELQRKESKMLKCRIIFAHRTVGKLHGNIQHQPPDIRIAGRIIVRTNVVEHGSPISRKQIIKLNFTWILGYSSCEVDSIFYL